MNRSKHEHPEGHLLVPALAIGALSVLLAVGLGVSRILDRLDLVAAGLSSTDAKIASLIELPPWMVWLATVIFAFGMSFMVLSVAGTWRRVVLWVSAMVLVAGWAPVLCLAARAPDIAGPFIVTVWSGVCALVYAENHRMPVDSPAPLPSAKTSRPVP